MARGRKAGSPAPVKEETPKVFFSEDYMGKCDKRQITLYGRRDKKDTIEEEEITDDEKAEEEAGWYFIGHYGYFSVTSLFNAIKTDMLLRKIKKAKVIEDLEAFEKMFEKNQKDFYKLLDKYDKQVEVPKSVEKKLKAVETELNKDSKDND